MKTAVAVAAIVFAFGLGGPLSAASPAPGPGASPRQRPDIAGTILGAGGKPLAGATVYVDTAAVRTGTSPFCPSCYPDCGRRVRTDAQGRFLLHGVDPALTFRLLIVHTGYAPAFCHVDPLKGPVQQTLTPRPAPASSSDSAYVTGVLRDPLGHPVEGATVEIAGERQGDTATFGYIPGVDPLVVSDESGKFLIHVSHPKSQYALLVTARGLAPQIVPEATPGVPVELPLKYGAALRGVVLGPKGEPLPGVIVHVNQKNRDVQTFLGHPEIGTNEKGEFLFTNLAPDQEYLVCPAMESLAKLGGIAAPMATVLLPGDGKTYEGLRLTAGPARTVAGVVRLSDGRPVPAGTRVMLGRFGMWDVQFTFVDAQGRFAFQGAPSDRLELAADIRGYKISRKTPGIDTSNPWDSSVYIREGGDSVSSQELIFEPEQTAKR